MEDREKSREELLEEIALLKEEVLLNRKRDHERRLAESAQCGVEERFRELIWMAPVGICLNDLSDGRFLSVNAIICQLAGYTEEEFANMTAAEFLVREDEKARHLERMSVTMEGGFAPLETQYLIRTRSGKELWVDFRVQVIYENGQAVKTLSVLSDITDKKAAEESLKKNEALLRTVLDSATDGLFDLNPATGEVHFGERAARLLGFEPENPPKTLDAWISCLHPDDRERIAAAIQEALAEPPGLFVEEFRVPADDGAVRTVRTRARVVERDDQGRPLRFVGAFQDETSRKKAEEDKERLKARLARAERLEAIGRLAGGVAHDFNNALSIILGNTELALLLIPGSDPARPCLEQAREASLRARDVVERILLFSQKNQSRKKRLSLTSVVEDSLKLLRASTPSTVEIRTRFTSQRDEILGDPDQLHQILLQLTSNALHAMGPEGGKLGISLSDVVVGETDAPSVPGLFPGPYVLLQVEDPGARLSAEARERAFEPYYASSPEKGPGGVGLAAVYGIVRSHGGMVVVENRPGNGALFNLYFPPAPGGTQAVPGAGESSAPDGRRILFVDDEAAVSAAMGKMLTALGYDVQCHTSPEKALAAFKADPDSYALLITDRAMPVMTGEELGREFRKIRPEMPVILVTGYHDGLPEDISDAYALLLKPIEINVLEDTVLGALGGTSPENGRDAEKENP